MKKQIREVLPFLAIVAASVALGVYRVYNQEKEETKKSSGKAELLKSSATLIEKSEPYRWSTITRDLYLDMDGNLKTTEAIVRANYLTERPAINAAIRDMTNGTQKTLAEWKKFGYLHIVR